MGIEIDVYGVVFDLKWTHVFEWCMTEWESKGGRGGEEGGEEELDYVLDICRLFNAIVKIIGELYVNIL